MGSQKSPTRAASVGAGLLALWASLWPGVALAQGSVALDAVVARLLATVQPDGQMDLAGFTCTPIDLVPDLSDCRDPQTGLGFIHAADPQGHPLGISIVKGVAGYGPTGIRLSDRAALETLQAEVRALRSSPFIADLTFCATPNADPEALAFGLRTQPGGPPVFLVIGTLSYIAGKELDTPGNEGAVLSALVIVVRPEDPCNPLD